MAKELPPRVSQGAATPTAAVYVPMAFVLTPTSRFSIQPAIIGSARTSRREVYAASARDLTPDAICFSVDEHDAPAHHANTRVRRFGAECDLRKRCVARKCVLPADHDKNLVRASVLGKKLSRWAHDAHAASLRNF